MKFWEIFRFELGYQSRKVSTWIFFIALFGLTFFIATGAYLENAQVEGYLFNSPYVIGVITLLVSLMGLLVPAALAGNAGARDIYTGIHPLFFTSPISKFEYLGGRYLAIFVLNALLMISVPIALILLLFIPGIDSEIIGPFQLSVYLEAYITIALPNVFFASVLLYSVVILTRQTISSYVAGVILFFLVLVSWLVVARLYGLWDVAKILDPFGLTIFSELSMQWTNIEKNTKWVGVSGWFLWNRLVWISISFAVLISACLRFRMWHYVSESFWGISSKLEQEASESLGIKWSSPITIKSVQRHFDYFTRVLQMFSIASNSFWMILKSWGGLVLVAITMLLVLTLPSMMTHMGVPLIPTTAHITAFLAAPLASPPDLLWMAIPLLIVFYAGELIWKERDVKINEITDTTPVPDLVFFFGKFTGLGLVLVALQALLIIAGVTTQILMGYYNFELKLYAKILLGLQLLDYVLFALLALVVHVIVNQKYLGYAVLIVVYTFMTFAPSLGIEHNLLIYGSDPGWWYSGFFGLGPFLWPWLWFKLYWLAWAIMLVVAAKLFWMRGKESDFASRFKKARDMFTPPLVKMILVVVGILFILTGFILYNTEYLNNSYTASELDSLRAQYERKYHQYNDAYQPQLKATNLHVDIYPKQRKVNIKGSYELVNIYEQDIDSIYLTTSRAVEIESLSINRPSKQVLSDEELGYSIYDLDEPLQPGDSLQLRFQVKFNPTGFPNSSINTSVVSNGTYFSGPNWLPHIGYQQSRELTNVGQRREHGLSPRPVYPSVLDYKSEDNTEGVNRIDFNATVSTDEEQVAVAPGMLKRTWMNDGRRYFSYSTSAPIRNDYAFYSADYEMYDHSWDDVTIQVFHHPNHDWIVESMTKSVNTSLEYFSEKFGAYPYKQLRLVEHPGQGNTLHAAPINISYEERFALFSDKVDSGNVNFPFAIIAHEVAHQWWGNQVAPAMAEGALLLTESLAWYSAMGVIEENFGPKHLRQLLSMMREQYQIPRSRAAEPLLRATDSFLVDRKGPFVLYALQEYIGKEHMHSALKQFYKKYVGEQHFLPTSLDLYEELQIATPDSLQYLLKDLFEENTYWELEAEGAQVEQLNSKEWRLTLEVSSRKVVVDSSGTEKEMTMNDWIEIGVFAEAGGTEPIGKPIYLKKHRLRSGTEQINLIVNKKPAQAGIDPNNLLIDLTPEDNLLRIK